MALSFPKQKIHLLRSKKKKVQVSDYPVKPSIAAQTEMRGMNSLLLCVTVTLCGASYPSFDTMVNYPRPSQESLPMPMQMFVVDLHNNDLRICLCKNQRAKTCKAGLLPQWLTAIFSGQYCKPEISELLKNPSDNFSDIIPLYNCDDPRKHLNNLSCKRQQ